MHHTWRFCGSQQKFTEGTKTQGCTQETCRGSDIIRPEAHAIGPMKSARIQRDSKLFSVDQRRPRSAKLSSSSWRAVPACPSHMFSGLHYTPQGSLGHFSTVTLRPEKVRFAAIVCVHIHKLHLCWRISDNLIYKKVKTNASQLSPLRAKWRSWIASSRSEGLGSSMAVHGSFMNSKLNF